MIKLMLSEGMRVNVGGGGGGGGGGGWGKQIQKGIILCCIVPPIVPTILNHVRAYRLAEDEYPDL